MRLSTEQLREAREIVEQWRRPSQRDEEWEAEVSKVRALNAPPRPSASDLKLERLERALVNWYWRAFSKPPKGESGTSE
jgi:hypothetical protein